MSNELIIILSSFTSIVAVFLAGRLGTKWLFGIIILNLVLISTFGAKLISVFGLVTNVGNVFYACVFLATHFLLEQREKENVLRTIWSGSCFVALFLLMSQFVLNFDGLPPNSPTNEAILNLFSLSPRIALGSILAYIFAQYVNIKIYSFIALRTKEKFLWFKSNGANILAQLVDSLLFFSIAFFDLPGPLLLQAILTGWLVKILVVALGTPFLYMHRYLEQKKS